MNITHPYNGRNKGTTLPEDLVKAISAIKATLPTVERAARTKPYWKAQGLGDKVPAGTYTDPKPGDDKARQLVDDTVVAVYQAMGGTPVTRHRMAIALNFQVADDVDIVRARLEKAGRIDTDGGVTPGAPGRSVRAVTPKAPVKAAAKGNGKAAAKAS